jgi:hypothetical protein
LRVHTTNGNADAMPPMVRRIVFNLSQILINCISTLQLKAEPCLYGIDFKTHSQCQRGGYSPVSAEAELVSSSLEK